MISFKEFIEKSATSPWLGSGALPIFGAANEQFGRNITKDPVGGKHENDPKKNAPIIPGKTDPETGDEMSVADQAGDKTSIYEKRQALSDITHMGTRMGKSSPGGFGFKAAGLFGNSEKDFYKWRKAQQATEDPHIRHQLATGQHSPVSALLGYSHSLPILAMLTSLFNPKLGAGLMTAQMVGKNLYELTHPMSSYKDIAFAKTMQNKGNLSNALEGVGTYDSAKRKVLPPGMLNRLINLG
jgi:hypothetical protein